MDAFEDQQQDAYDEGARFPEVPGIPVVISF